MRYWDEHRWSRPSRARAFLLIGITIGLMIAVGAHLIRRQAVSHSLSTAQVVTGGYDKSRAVHLAEPEDETLSDDVAAAGAMWAERHRPLNADECPDYTVDFRKGCADYVRGPER